MEPRTTSCKTESLCIGRLARRMSCQRQSPAVVVRKNVRKAVGNRKCSKQSPLMGLLYVVMAVLTPKGDAWALKCCFSQRTFGRSILGGLLLEEGLVDMGDHTTTRNGRLRVQDNWARVSVQAAHSGLLLEQKHITALGANVEPSTSSEAWRGFSP